MAAGYVIRNTADFATHASGVVLLNVINAANSLIRVTGFGVSFDGTSASAEPVVVELFSCTQATAGTPGSSPTPTQVRGATRTVQATAGIEYTNANMPTVITPTHVWLVHPQSGITVQFPLGREPEQVVTADALGIKVSAPAAVNARGWLEFEEG